MKSTVSQLSPFCCCLLTPLWETRPHQPLVYLLHPDPHSDSCSRGDTDPFFRSFLPPPHIRRPNPPPKYVKRNILSRVERVWNFKFSSSLTKCHFWHIWLELSTRLGPPCPLLIWSSWGPIFAPRAPLLRGSLTIWARVFTKEKSWGKFHSETFLKVTHRRQDGE